jgi:hypothetical protein
MPLLASMIQIRLHWTNLPQNGNGNKKRAADVWYLIGGMFESWYIDPTSAFPVLNVARWT